MPGTDIVLFQDAIEALPLPLYTSALAATPAARNAAYEARWAHGAWCFLNVYGEFFFSIETNDTLAEFLRAKIRQAVPDPILAARLTPRSYLAFTRRQSVCDDYDESYHRPNVSRPHVVHGHEYSWQGGRAAVL